MQVHYYFYNSFAKTTPRKQAKHYLFIGCIFNIMIGCFLKMVGCELNLYLYTLRTFSLSTLEMVWYTYCRKLKIVWFTYCRYKMYVFLYLPQSLEINRTIRQPGVSSRLPKYSKTTQIFQDYPNIPSLPKYSKATQILQAYQDTPSLPKCISYMFVLTTMSFSHFQKTVLISTGLVISVFIGHFIQVTIGLS